MSVLALLLGSLGLSQAFYLPGVSPREYADGEPVDLKVNKLDSVKTQLPYDYYSLPFCQPDKITEVSENLGEVISGEKIESSAYNIRMRKTESCKVLCQKEYKAEEMKQFAEKIHEDYQVNWIVDNIPVAEEFIIVKVDENSVPLPDNTQEKETLLMKGYALGRLGTGPTDKGVAYINNHVHMTLLYHEDPASFEGYRIVGFHVQAFSVNHQSKGKFDGTGNSLKTCKAFSANSNSQTMQPVEGSNKIAMRDIIFTYDVEWEASPIKWASRWDLYLKMNNVDIHWFSIANSFIIAVCLSTVVALTLIKTLRGDLQRYNEVDPEEALEETGWKLVHGEVFRPPAYAGTFSMLLGTGCQLVAMSVSTLVFACLGFLSPSNRGGLMTALLLLFVFCGIINGYVTTRTFKMFGLTSWKTNTLRTALFFPGVTFSIFFIMNLFVWGEKSTGAVPFGTLVALLVLWLGISAPLVYLGSYFAFKREAIKAPVRVNNIPRMLPPADKIPWFMRPACCYFAGGAVVFGSCFAELHFILDSVWHHQFYYMFGMLAVIFLLLVITSAEVSVILVYFQLCSEDYHWWWRSIFYTGTSGLLTFAFSVHYFFTGLEVLKFVTGLLFFGYMFLLSLAFFLVTGTIGHFAAYYFVSKIYASVKID